MSEENKNIDKFLERLKERDVSLVEERNFVKAVTDGYNIEKLQLLKLDVEFAIEDEKMDVMEKNYEIKRNTNDEFYLSGLTDKPFEAFFKPRLFRLERLMRHIEYKIEQLQESRSGSKLSVASDWMDPLIKRIINININDSKEANRKVGKILQKEYKGFIKEFPFEELKTDFVSGGTLTKKSIALAIMFIFEERHDDKIKDYTAITKRYKHLDWE